MSRNTLKLETSGFAALLKKLESMGGDVQRAAGEALEKAGQKIAADTDNALSANFLPAGGQYSTGKTRESIIHDAKVTWEGSVGWVPVGFDFSKSGAGGYLITGTPRMRPDMELHRMYKQKKYMLDIQEDMAAVVLRHIVEM